MTGSYPLLETIRNPAERTLRRLVNENGDNRKPGITWGQRVGNPECPYLRRWVVNYGAGSLRVHHWTASDDPRHLHDHPWWFVTFVLRGGYRDIHHCPACNGTGLFHPHMQLVCSRCAGVAVEHDDLKAPAIRYRPALHAHTVQVNPGGCWTIMLTGRHMRDWGFYAGGAWKRMRRYFKEYGHHPCE